MSETEKIARVLKAAKAVVEDVDDDSFVFGRYSEVLVRTVVWEEFSSAVKDYFNPAPQPPESGKVL
jgi:hypothetical protein